MREIRFRAWHKKNKGMVSGADLKDWFRVVIETGINPLNQDAEFMQYTGLKDKNGKDIYEGDMVTDIYGHKLEVVFEGGCFKAVMEGLEIEDAELAGIYKNNKTDFEVIGNIYENPELLEKV